MIGSISKIRPCGHSCHYKYVHIKTASEISIIDRGYKCDVDGEGVWNKNLDSITDCYSLLKNCSFIKKVNLKLPKATSLWDFLHSSSNVVSIKVEAPIAKKLSYAFFNTKELDEIEVYCPKCTDIDGTFGGSYSKTEPKLGLKSATHASDAFNSFSTRMNKFGSNLENVTNIINIFYYQDQLTELKYPIDEDGECIYDSGKEHLIIDGVKQYKYIHFPKLITGTNAFHMCRLDKPTTISILESLPIHSDGASHPLCIGIHKDHQYDPDVNIALKRCQNSYVTPIEEYGALLPENITTDKGWTLTVQWNGTATENAYPPPQQTVEEI